MTWYVNFPLFQYEEDVKDLAKKHNLKIIDAKFQGNNLQAKNAPELTIKGQEKPKRTRAKKEE
jgi:aspartyl-tRNA synthetase